MVLVTVKDRNIFLVYLFYETGFSLITFDVVDKYKQKYKPEIYKI